MDDDGDGESALLPPTGEATTVEEGEVRKEAARLELMEPLREPVGEAVSEGVQSRDAARLRAILGL